MKVVKIIKSTLEENLEITGATLLSVEEAEKYLEIEERADGSYWWLRTPCYDCDYVSYVEKDGWINELGVEVNYEFEVRPALHIKNLESFNFEIGDTFELGNFEFKIISKDLAWMYNKQSIGHYTFNEDFEKGNDYEKSDVKKFVDKWFEDLISNKSEEK